MSEFNLHLYSGRAYTAEECIRCSWNDNPNIKLDLEKEMEYHKHAKHIQISGLTQEDFELFVEKYADNYLSIYFFQNPKVRDISALKTLKNVEYLLFYNLKLTKSLWDMSENKSLKGIMISDSKNMVYDISPIEFAPNLEELLLFSSMDRKYIVHSLAPIKNNKTLKKVMLECNTENKDFNPSDFNYLEVFNYQVDRKRNYSY